VVMRLDVATAQILTGELSAREVEDVDTATLSYAEVKALATGQPLLLEAATVAAGIARLRNHKLATSVPNAASARTSTSSSATPRAARSAPGRWRPWPSTPPAATRYSRRTVAGPWPTAPPSPRPSPLRPPPRCSKVPANTWASGAGSASRSPPPRVEIAPTQAWAASALEVTVRVAYRHAASFEVPQSWLQQGQQWRILTSLDQLVQTGPDPGGRPPHGRRSSAVAGR
jgi:hypothetical protein